MADSIEDYVDERERECKQLSLHHMEPPTYAVEAGSRGRRGRIMMALSMTERAYLAVSELVEIRSGHVHRLEYAYYLILDEQEHWSRDFDSFHGYHGHGANHVRVEAGRVSFKEAAGEAWGVVSAEEELTGEARPADPDEEAGS